MSDDPFELDVFIEPMYWKSMIADDSDQSVALAYLGHLVLRGKKEVLDNILRKKMKVILLNDANGEPVGVSAGWVEEGEVDDAKNGIFIEIWEKAPLLAMIANTTAH